MTELIEVIEPDARSLDGPAFHLQSDSISYLFAVTRHGHLEHVHFGPALGRITSADLASLRVKQAGSSSAVKYLESDQGYSLDYLPLEYSGFGKGDYRLPPVELKQPDGSFVTDFRYRSHRIIPGVVPSLDAQPVAHADSGQATTLEVELQDGTLRMTLYYTIFADCHTVTRRVVLTNSGPECVSLRKLMSSQIDLPNRGFDLITFDGAWINETQRHCRPLAPGIYLNSSTTGFSSNRHNPGVLLARRGSTEDHGEVYGFNLVYSGNHYTAVELSHRELVRVMSGINPVGFEWDLGSGEQFQTPEAVLSYSQTGFNGLSENLHAFVNDHIVPTTWAGVERPVLLNNWEATNFDFKHSKLVNMARQARNLGAELFVLDDGWFGARNHDRAGLGDFEVNRKKLPKGLAGLAAEVRGLGLQFGLWVEPEMVNPDSELYRAHPDWAIQVPGRQPAMGRHQLVLDLTRPEVRDHLVEQVGRVLDEARVDYVKWDANRPLTDIWSPSCPGGEVLHRYVLGLYEVLDRIFTARPRILLESCASGGNRFDLGMLCFSPQIWASDCTDPAERLNIQLGLSHLYPQSTIGAHVTASPSEQTLRASGLPTRFNVAALGVLGYELDPSSLTFAEKREIRAQIAFYKAHRKLLQFGRQHRGEEVRKNQRTVSVHHESGEPGIVAHFQGRAQAAAPPEWLPIPGLQLSARYRVVSKSQSVAIRDFGRLVNHVSPVRISDGGLVQSLVNRFYRLPDASECYEGNGATLSRLQLTPQFDGAGQDAHTRLLGDYGSTLYVIERQIDSKDDR